MSKILLAEDDDNLGELLSEYFTLKGFEVDLCRDGQEALSTFTKKREYDICIFDVMMPIMDGFTLAQEVRKLDKLIPIIFLTAKDMKEDRIHGLEIGADDYLTKPFSMEELLLRIKAVLRRTTAGQIAQGQSKFQIGTLYFDFDAQTLKTPAKEARKDAAGEEIAAEEAAEHHLTSKEAQLLKMLCEHQNQTLERSKALTKIWLDDNYFNARSMDVYITKLRKFLKSDPQLKIINVHGTGFKLVVLTD